MPLGLAFSAWRPHIYPLNEQEAKRLLTIPQIKCNLSGFYGKVNAAVPTNNC